MARRCIWCGNLLPEPTTKGHRRREFCKPPKTCKQKHYLWHKKIKQDAEKLVAPAWHKAYDLLTEQYKFLELRLQETVEHLAKADEHIKTLEEILEYYRSRYKNIHIDYTARLKALGMNNQEIEEFNTYWKDQIEPFHS